MLLAKFKPVFSLQIIILIYIDVFLLFFNKNIVVFNQAFDIKLNFDASVDLFWALIVLIIAEIYRISSEIKKEQELTI